MNRYLASGVMVAALGVGVFAQAPGIREITLTNKQIVTVNTKVGLTTVIVLPPNEPVADVAWGSEVGWVVDELGNIIRVTPLTARGETNVHVIMPDSTIYTFLVKEGAKDVTTDLQIIAKSDKATTTQKRQFVPLDTHESELRALRDELNSMKDAVGKAQAGADQRADQQIAKFRQAYPLTIRQYETDALRVPPYQVERMWSDDEFTWIRLGARELPAVYEVLDGKPAIVNPISVPGALTTTFKIPKVVGDGYLKIGKAKEWRFRARS